MSVADTPTGDASLDELRDEFDGEFDTDSLLWSESAIVTFASECPTTCPGRTI